VYNHPTAAFFAGASSSKRAFREILQAKLAATFASPTIIPRHSSHHRLGQAAQSHRDKEKKLQQTRDDGSVMENMLEAAFDDR